MNLKQINVTVRLDIIHPPFIIIRIILLFIYVSFDFNQSSCQKDEKKL